MLFSFSLIKKLAPGQYDKKTLIEKLNLTSFEVADAAGDAMEVAVPPNRYSDAASHLGIARETAVMFDIDLKDEFKKIKPNIAKDGPLSVKVMDSKLCQRYLATYVAGVKVGSSPAWLKEVLEICGIRSINNIVDVMNYVMLEIGQPLHAFDADKIQNGIIVRKAKPKEIIETLDGGKYELGKDMLVIADQNQPLAIAGIKGGKISEVTPATKNILIEAANFDGIATYTASKKLNLRTDASIRFSHALAPELARLGMQRALQLIQEVAGGKLFQTTDFYPKKATTEMLTLDLEKINRIVGVSFSLVQAVKTLKQLGFIQEKKLWRVPEFRPDIQSIEDIAEELVRFYGLNQVPMTPPAVALGSAFEEDQLVLKDKLRNFLKGAGISEVYNYAFVSEEECQVSPVGVFGYQSPVPLANPMSIQSAYLRDNLAPGLIKNIKDNLRFYDEARIFEIGTIFGKNQKGEVQEKLVLGIALAAKQSVLELKGLIDALFGQLGFTGYSMPDLNLDSKALHPKEALRIETDEHEVVGYFGSLKGIRHGSIAELDLGRLLKIIEEEKEFKPIPKYPSVMRDVSLLVSRSVRVGEILSLLQNVSPKLIDNVDLIDFYEDEKLGDDRKSLTFRIVFQADDRTLTDEEVDREMAIIAKVIEDRFDAEIR
ncbi:MAG TPA: phenylalanine--tRNA ligase subunit beta [Candidatus Paceibacterota bacterium]